MNILQPHRIYLFIIFVFKREKTILWLLWKLSYVILQESSLSLVKLSIQISKISSCELFVSLEIASGIAMYKLMMMMMMMMMNCSCDMVDRKNPFSVTFSRDRVNLPICRVNLRIQFEHKVSLTFSNHQFMFLMI